MTKARMNKYSLFAGAVLLSVNTTVFALDAPHSVFIPVIDNAHVFANFTHDIPAVLNYFTSSSEDKIIDFYEQRFGESIFKERKRDRLMLTFNNENKTIRVIISQQNSKRQVDILVDKTPE
ncbi:hypothetical protein [Colwellia sp. E150_009]